MTSTICNICKQLKVPAGYGPQRSKYYFNMIASSYTHKYCTTVITYFHCKIIFLKYFSYYVFIGPSLFQVYFFVHSASVLRRGVLWRTSYGVSFRKSSGVSPRGHLPRCPLGSFLKNILQGVLRIVLQCVPRGVQYSGGTLTPFL